ncbi:DNA repair protein XRCC1 isoform X1 [Gadus macrocephalus]|uniref:DNA repair protein XRCC1 isoform X1 n=1 Tax=Gadus macrocephalus TaxID=80720 RepID=UPI0028CB6F40|nr:DNA repair protein XRCC1 isoform X1 [Gadus macrocephalus]XP_059911156.1 DNA repair protein XRCC1 isoform X1 [Gadus macrocephalus]
MPEIKMKHVVSCSSEDTTHKADNLLSSDTYRKWKAARPGEKQTSVILQLEKEDQIHSIDIGNEGSAFIEVLVGNSSSTRDQDYEVLLVTSSFMSPTESRNNTNTGRVRFFGPSQLQKTPAQEKWDRVKIVCSQPYSKNIAYGVAFVKFHSPPDKNDPPTTPPPKLTKLGQFRLKDESPPASTSLQPGSLFFNRENTKPSPAPKVSPQNDKLSYAAAALQTGGGSQPSKSPQQAVKKKFEFSKERQDAPAASPSTKATPPGSPERKPPTPKATAKNPTPKATPKTTTPTPKAKASPAAPSSSSKASTQKVDSRRREGGSRPSGSDPVPLNRVLEGVVFVLSGFQNPFRAELRDKALALGAKYRPDWASDTTHLICAFANTPKYSQVKSAGGLIVRKEWVLDCHKRKCSISYKRYLMDGAEDSSGSEMELGKDSEDEQETRRTPQKPVRQATPRKTIKIEEDEYGASTDIEEGAQDGDSAMDTEDELQRVESDKPKAGEKKIKTEDPYGGSTDENTDAEEEQDQPIPELPDYLTGKRFFLFGKFPNNERRLLLRYIAAFNGQVEDYMDQKVQFVVTSEGWQDSFEDALMENGNLNIVKPSWIYAINDRQKMLPYQPYTVVP